MIKHWRPQPTRRRSLLCAAGALLALATVGQLDTSSAAFTANTEALDSSVTAIAVEPPTAITANTTTDVVPLLTCRVELEWTASTTPGIDGYEIIRVVAATGVTRAGPWTTTATSFVDDPVPLQVAGSEYEWRVRTMLDSWRSSWEAAIPTTCSPVSSELARLV